MKNTTKLVLDGKTLGYKSLSQLSQRVRPQAKLSILSIMICLQKIGMRAEKSLGYPLSTF